MCMNIWVDHGFFKSTHMDVIRMFLKCTRHGYRSQVHMYANWHILPMQCGDSSRTQGILTAWFHDVALLLRDCSQLWKNRLYVFTHNLFWPVTGLQMASTHYLMPRTSSMLWPGWARTLLFFSDINLPPTCITSNPLKLREFSYFFSCANSKSFWFLNYDIMEIENHRIQETATHSHNHAANTSVHMSTIKHTPSVPVLIVTHIAHNCKQSGPPCPRH